MALIKQILKQKIQEFGDQLSPLFQGFPSNLVDNADKWGDAIDTYASVVTPISTNNVLAKKALIDIMKGVLDPVDELVSPFPFTIYYKSPETRMYQFNKYLTKDVGYKSNPTLDKSEVFQRLNRIRETYNKLYPVLALTVEDIFYNQRRFNQIYKNDIDNGRKFKLLQDGVTIDSKGLPSKYSHIPVNNEGVIIPLQEDGIIGDDTIRYWPIVSFAIYELDKNPKWNAAYSKIPFITQPGSSGDVWLGVPKLMSTGDYDIRNEQVSNLFFRKNFIDKGLSKDYTKIMIDKSQFDLDGGLGNDNSTFTSFKDVYEANHSTCDQFWLINKITTIEQYVTLLISKRIVFDANPKVKKNGITALENGIMAYAQLLAVGMTPNYTAAPSVLPLSFNSAKAKGMAGGSNNQCITTMSNIIDSYFRAGIATDNSSGVTIPWS